jgi:hypothetical protein
MPVLQEGRYAGEFVVSEGNGRISRETITILTGQNLSRRRPRQDHRERQIQGPRSSRR